MAWARKEMSHEVFRGVAPGHVKARKQILDLKFRQLRQPIAQRWRVIYDGQQERTPTLHLADETFARQSKEVVSLADASFLLHLPDSRSDDHRTTADDCAGGYGRCCSARHFGQRSISSWVLGASQASSQRAHITQPGSINFAFSRMNGSENSSVKRST